MKRRGRFNRGELTAVGRRLRLRRVAKGWSLKKLSEVSRVSIAAIRKIELGESNPSLLTVLALVEALGEPVDRLIGDVLRSGERIQFVRAAEDAGGLDKVSLSDDLPSCMMAGRRVALAAGDVLMPADQAANRPLFAYVLDGEVVLSRADGQEDTCRRGDSFHIYQPHRDTVRGAAVGATLVVVENTVNNVSADPHVLEGGEGNVHEH